MSLDATPTSVTNGTVIQYTVNLTNTGLKAANNSILKTIPSSGFSFVVGSVKINGTSSSDSIVTGVNLGTINPTQHFEVIFNLRADNLPNYISMFPNNCNLTYDFLSSIGTTINGESTTNICYVYTPTYKIDAQLSLSCNKVLGSIGDTLEYTIDLENLQPGQDAYDASMIISNYRLPQGLELIPDSIKFDGNPIPGSVDANISIPDLKPFIPHKFTFSIRVVSPPNNKFDYTFNCQINYNMSLGGSGTANVGLFTNKSTVITPDSFLIPTLSITSDKTNALVNPSTDTIEYTITILNPYPNTISGITLFDILPSGLSYKTNSLVIDKTPSTQSLKSGVSLKNLTTGSSTTIKFIANVDSPPNKGFVYPNFATINYSVPTAIGTIPETINTTTINSYSPPKIDAIISTNKTFISLPPNNGIEYTVTLTNTTTLDLTDVTLIDILPPTLQYQPNSLTINGINPIPPLPDDTLTTGISLGHLSPSDIIIVKFIVLSTSKPPNNKYANFATINYNFVIPGNTLPYSINTNTIDVFYTDYLTQINPLTFKNTIYITNKNTPIKESLSVINLTNASPNCTLNTYPINGYAEVNTNGQWHYTPKLNFIGKDTFSILSTDKDLGSSISIITIIVKEPYDFLNSQFCLN